MQLDEIPKKKEYRVGEVCELVDTQPYVLQFWETEFPQLSPKQRGSGARFYSRSDLKTVLEIKRLLQEENLTIAQARERIENGGGKTTAKTASGTPEIHAIPRTAPTTATVERDRYDAAVREVQRLKAELSSRESVELDQTAYDEIRQRAETLESALREANAEIKDLQKENSSRSEKAAKLADRLDTLAERLAQTD
jgi:DNA-binding transcriptional MerR regulator